MEKISSSQNKLVKKLVQISKKQSFRKKTGLTILDGVHLVEDYFSKVGRPEICVISKGAKSEEVLKFAKKMQKSDVRMVELTVELFSKISPVENGVGVLFVVKIPENRSEILQENSLILEDIQDAGNLGTILRSTAAFGVRQIFCSKNTVSAWSPKVLRAGMGAHFGLEIFENCDLNEVIKKLEIPVFATSLEAKKSIFEEDLSGKTAWIFGNEGKGVSKELQELATKKVIIPQKSNVESLNVAMAATVCLSESFRQNLKK